MKKIALAGVLFLSMAGSLMSQIKQDRNVGAFSKIKVSSAIKLVITMGNEAKVSVEAEEHVIDKIKTEVKNGELHLYSKNHYSTSKGVVVYVTASALTAIDASGATNVSNTNAINAKSFDVECSGASSVKLDVNTSDLNLDISGASVVNMKGNTTRFNATISGASSLKTEELINKEALVHASGASAAKVYAGEVFKAEASGASSIKYYGDPKDKSIETSGASSIKKG